MNLQKETHAFKYTTECPKILCEELDE